MGDEIATNTVNCPKCGRPLDVSFETRGVFVQRSSITIVCPWNDCGHIWISDWVIPGKHTATKRRESS
jgi:hypothetical protein